MTDEAIERMVKRGTCPLCGARLARDGARKRCPFLGAYRVPACGFVWPRAVTP